MIDRTKEQTHALTILGVILAGALTVITGEGPFSLWDIMIGILLLLVLHTSDTSGIRPLALAAVWSFCLILAFGFPFTTFLVWLQGEGWFESVLSAALNFLHAVGYVEDKREQAFFFVHSSAGLFLWMVVTICAWFTIVSWRKRKLRRESPVHPTTPPEAPQEPSEALESATDATGGVVRPARGGAQEDVRRPWWRRLFGS